jgi:alpha-ketoglutarate-dependent taurine dioxygenase
MSELQLLPIKKSWADRRSAIKPQAISFSTEQLVEFSLLRIGTTLPLVIKPRLADVDLAGWTRANLEFIEPALLKHGGLLFRGFGIKSQAEFLSFLTANNVQLMDYMEGATPRTLLGERIYTSTEFPPTQSIALHNELSYVSTFPMKVWFYCLQPPTEQGETPIADVRKVLRRISPSVRKRFVDKGWMLVRNFGDGFSLPWESAFHTDDPAEVEAYCRRAAIGFEWKDGNRLRTQHVRPPVAVHPKTGEEVWFNHIAFWHVSSLASNLLEMMLSEFKQADLPYNTYYGDGSPIEPQVIEELRQAYSEETITFPWQQGDILMLDNMLVAHGRAPYAGDRKILVSMGQPQQRADV